MSQHPSAAAARAWLADDPDPVSRAQLQRWLDEDDADSLDEAFGERLQFGTSGIRGPLGPGPARMNRVLARRVAAGLAALLGDGATVVVGRDARHGSDAIAGDVAAVLAGAGARVLVLPGIVPTPLLAFAVRHLGGDAGVMVTASHNPPGENGVKVYGADGAQLAAPRDTALSAAIDAVGRVLDLPLGTPETVDGAVLDAYVEQAAARVPAGPRGVRIVHTPLHGVAGGPLLRLLDAAGFDDVHVVTSQAEPDPDFPTVAFPNPEEPGALDLALAQAVDLAADVVLATDPDGDRLGVAVPDGGGWRTLTGDELGALLAEQALATTSGEDRLVACSFVSSTLLQRLAEAEGVPCDVTPTGFKWIVRATDRHPGRRLVFAYEEALGYAVHDLVRDKDGLTAAAAMAALVAGLKAEGSSVPERLDAIARRHGLHACRQWAIRLDGAEGVRRIREAVAALADAPPGQLDGRAVRAVERPAEGVVLLHLDGDARVVVRPSGTEPKLKRYFQVVVDPVGDVAAARREAAAALERLRDDLDGVLQL